MGGHDRTEEEAEKNRERGREKRIDLSAVSEAGRVNSRWPDGNPSNESSRTCISAENKTAEKLKPPTMRQEENPTTYMHIIHVPENSA